MSCLYVLALLHSQAVHRECRYFGRESTPVELHFCPENYRLNCPVLFHITANATTSPWVNKTEVFVNKIQFRENLSRSFIVSKRKPLLLTSHSFLSRVDSNAISSTSSQYLLNSSAGNFTEDWTKVHSQFFRYINFLVFFLCYISVS